MREKSAASLSSYSKPEEKLMKYNVKIGDKTYEVEIEDINKRPIVVRVDGQEFEVSPDTSPVGSGIKAAMSPSETVSAPVGGKKPIVAAAPSSMNVSGNILVSPLPGTVTEVFVKAGEEVEAGQVILVIEAMKMKNSIRSVRDGIVAAVHVRAGQTVAHKQSLVEFQV
jgi:glutaconyl-CoA/methylmalonyl-CoA decarboxylase subunit gamma